jgi:hypothetical protein
MIITVNGFVLNDPNSGNGVYLDEPVGGLSMAPIRTSQGTYSGRDGGYVGAQFYSGRLISLTGKIFNTQSSAAVEAIRRAFEAALAAPPPLVMTIVTNGGSQYALNVYVDSLDIPINRSPSQAPFNLSLIAPDPTIYDNSAGGLNTVTINPVVGGGLTWPLTWPLPWSAGTQPITINNSGNVTIYLTITLTGAMTNPTVLNVTTGQFFSLTGLTTSAGDVLVIDLLNRSVMLNGGSVLSYAALTSSWWPLVPGSNTIKFTTTNSSDPVTGTLSWRSGYRGI